MQFCKFIECRIGEPITALDVYKNFVLLGSISGYFGVYNVADNIVCFSEGCEKQLIRDCCLHIGADRKFKNPQKNSDQNDSDNFFDNKDEDSEVPSNQYIDDDSIDMGKYGKSSVIYNSPSDIVFDYEKGVFNFGYLAIGDSSILRIDLDRFCKERLIHLTQTPQKDRKVLFQPSKFP